MRLAGQAKGGYYPTPKRVVEYISTHITTQPNPHNIDVNNLLIDPCCGPGTALATLAQRIARRARARLTTYGVELQRPRAREASIVLNKTMSADIFNTTIGHGTFGLLYLNPPYDFDAGQKPRTEHAFLTRTTRYLDTRGVLVFIIPQAQLATSAEYLSAYYTNIKCYAFPSPERDDYNQVVLFGLRKPTPNHSPNQTKEITKWATGDVPDLFPTNYPNYVMPNTTLEQVMFMTQRFDPEEAAVQAQTLGLWANPILSDALWPTGKKHTHPLMPLRRGHTALLLAAGFMDNMPLEKDGNRILVKGRTTKENIHIGTDDITGAETYREVLNTTVVSLDLHSGQFEDIAT